MIGKTAEIVKNNVGKTISIASVVAVVGLYSALTKVLDDRYCLASEAQQTQQTMVNWMEQDLEDKIFMIEMKESKGVATDEDRAMKQRYIRRLEKLRMKQ